MKDSRNNFGEIVPQLLGKGLAEMLRRSKLSPAEREKARQETEEYLRQVERNRPPFGYGGGPGGPAWDIGDNWKK